MVSHAGTCMWHWPHCIDLERCVPQRVDKLFHRPRGGENGDVVETLFIHELSLVLGYQYTALPGHGHR
jgi:hypothetical protein